MKPDAATDYGAQPWRILKEEPADPDAPNRTISRGRRYDAVRWLETRKSIDRSLVVAADKFRDDWALACGAREGLGATRLDPWQRCHYAAKVADARARANAALVAVGKRHAAIFGLAVIPADDEPALTVRQIEDKLRMRHGEGAKRIAEALERLRDWQTENGR